MSSRPATALVIAIAVAGVLAGAQVPAPQTPRPSIPQSVRDRVQQTGRARVIVELRTPGAPEGELANVPAILRQRQGIADARTRMLQRLPAFAQRIVHRYQTVPFVALDVDADGLAALERAGADVARVVEDTIVRPVLADSVPIVQGDQAWEAGYDGSGTTIAVLDTGIDASHPFLAGKVVEEACYSTTTANLSRSTCPNGADEQIGPGAGAPCAMADCVHGTHVAGIAAGNGAPAGVPFSGVAKGAGLMAVQVFSEIINPLACGGGAPCAGAFNSDIVAGLERVYAVAALRNVVSVNMSLGGATSATACDSDPTKPIIDNLRSIGVATVIAAGNNGFPSRLSAPGCVSTAVSVGSTNKADAVSYFSNAAPFLSLFAPGEAITSSVPGGGYDTFSGTSMATPHVAGTWAILKQALPAASVGDLLDALRATGRPIADTRSGGTVTIPRERLFQALASLVPVTNPAPDIASIAPVRGRANTSFTLTVSGAHFNAFSTVRWNGADVPTTAVSTTSLRAAVPASALPTAGTADVTVFTATPGGGTTSSLPFTIDPPPTLTVSASPVAAGASETVTLANGFGGRYDWIALAMTGAAETSYVTWTYVGNGVTERAWTVTMPQTPGTYEFRLYRDNGFTRAATSAPVTVDPALSPVPAIGSLSPVAALAGGAAFTLTVNGSSFANTSIVRWNGASRPTTFISATRLQAAIAASDIASLGVAQVTVFTPSPGGGTSATLPFAINPAPLLTISTPSVPASGSVTVTLTNGLGGAFDWLALASTTAANTSYLQFIYVGAGVTSRTWTVTMPATPGTYEFRLFLNNGYTRAATSPSVAVAGGTAPTPTIDVNTNTVAGGASVTMTLSGGLGGSFDWLALAQTSAPNTSYVQYVYVGAGVTSRTWTMAMPVAPGTYEFRLFQNNGYTRLATSAPITVAGAAQPPTLDVSATSVSGGASVTVTLGNGLGGTFDWIALALSSAPNTSYVQYVYVGGGTAARTWTVTMPPTPGTYEFRLFLNNGYTRAATSPPVVVSPL